MHPLMILFADITAVVCAVGAIIFGILLFSNWGEHKAHGDHSHDSDHAHH